MLWMQLFWSALQNPKFPINSQTTIKNSIARVAKVKALQ